MLLALLAAWQPQSQAQGLALKGLSQTTSGIESAASAVKVKDVLHQLREYYQADILFADQLVAERTVSSSIIRLNQSLEQNLEALLKPVGLRYKKTVDGSYLITPAADKEKKLPPKTAASTTDSGAIKRQDNQTVSGKVTDENGDVLPGVTVLLKGTTTAVPTNAAGDYTLIVPEGSGTLVFSFIGYQSQEIAMNSRTTINVQMATDAKALSEVVVVGYGTQKKADVTGAVASANLEDFQNAPNTNIAQSLQGTVPGLNIGQVTSAGSTPSINIRGANTISGRSGVLIVVDGIQYNNSLESINPDDIASIDVLKDASATAVYGAQASNGVLLITTRKGTKGQKPRVSFSSSYATQTPTVSLRPMRREEYLEKIRMLNYDKAFLAPDYTQPNPDFNFADVIIDPPMKDADGNLVATDFDWWDAATDMGFVQDNQLSISGGSDRFTYLFSGGYTNQSGFIINDKFKRKSLRINLDSHVTDWWTIGIQSSGSFVNKDGAEPNISTIIQQSPLIEPFDAEGNLKPFPFDTNFGNPFLTYYTDDYERNNYLFANIYSEINFPFIKGLSYRLNFGNNYRTNQRYDASIYGGGHTGSASKFYNNYYDYTLDNIVTYNTHFGKHDVTATLLYGAIERQEDNSRAFATAYPRLTLGYHSLQQGENQFVNSDAWHEVLNYQMARLNYKFADRYLLTATVRRDGYSGFASNYKWATFPSVALGWVLSEESFFRPLSTWVDFLKVRAGYGIAGNQTHRYQSLSRVGSGASYVFGDGGGTLFGQQVNSIANPNLRWEKTAGLNMGVDFRLLGNRLTGSLDHFNNITTDLLYDVTLPDITGFGAIPTNIGKLQTRGVEFALTSQNIDHRNFKWSTTFNFSRNTNKIITLLGTDADGDGVEDDLIASGLWIGRSLGTQFTYVTDGIYQIGDEIPAGYYPGTYRIVDTNEDGVINGADRVIHGRSEPSYRASLLNALEYKGFRLTVFLNTIQGGPNSYLAGNRPSIFRNDNNIRYNFLEGIDFWSPLNPDGKYPLALNEPTINSNQLQNRSFVRLQDISLSYRFTGDFIKSMNIQNLNVFVSAKNLATWTNWEGWDPETNQGLQNSARPVLKGYSVGFNLTL
ncbi:SusC/RagA family TonB-linked outer membrane protein [Pontibacter sp. SGAir0037]|nr:SusC/RagA family TonB-linked outer membrane protein [Pontibacter sp. SGAir0037]